MISARYLGTVLILGIAVAVSVVLITWKSKPRIAICNQLQGSSGTNPVIALPQAGTLDGPCKPIDLSQGQDQQNFLIFRSQMKAQDAVSANGLPSASAKAFEFPNLKELGKKGSQQSSLTAQVSALLNQTNSNALSANSGGGLYNQQVARDLDLPWPPLASAQVVPQVPNPNLEISPVNPLQCAGAPVNPVSACSIWSQVNSGQPTAPVPISQPNNTNAFVKVLNANPDPGLAFNTKIKSRTQVNLLTFQFQQTGVVQVEMAGGSGGDLTVGSSKQRITYRGGRPGIVWSYFSVKPGDVWQVQLSQDGTTFTVADFGKSVVPENSFASGGGNGSFLAGSEGGGVTYLSTNCPGSSAGPVPGTNHGTLLMAAGGGGGASRNAVGGSAGLSVPIQSMNQDLYGQVHPNRNFIGFPGGNTNYDKEFTIPEYMQGPKSFALSGGGGTITRGGQSSVKNLKNNTTKGLIHEAAELTKGKPLQGGSGSENPPGGGGGGAGFYGGAAGFWSGVPAPNNEHGAGGGGSSFVSNVGVSATQNLVVNHNVLLSDAATQPNTNSGSVPNAPIVNFEARNYFLLVLPQA